MLGGLLLLSNSRRGTSPLLLRFAPGFPNRCMQVTRIARSSLLAKPGHQARVETINCPSRQTSFVALSASFSVNWGYAVRIRLWIPEHLCIPLEYIKQSAPAMCLFGFCSR
jgi:hypothetical protein